MTKQLTSKQRYLLFVEHQNRGTRKEKTEKEIAAEIGVHSSTVSREYRRNAMPKAVVRLLYAYRLTGVLTITTDNGGEFADHKTITKGLKGVVVYFADSYCSWQKGLVENTNKLIRQYIPKGSDFSSLTPKFIREIRIKLNKRPREKLNYSTPVAEFFSHFS